MLSKTRKHFDRGTPLYRCWQNMKQRCTNSKTDFYANYGGRGIKVCKQWHNWFTFKAWALKSGYKKGLTIDRINPNGNYKPSNCKWSTQKEQANNKTNHRIVIYKGKKIKFNDLARLAVCSYDSFRLRLFRLKWDVERALTTS
jgi:hypothetical protein